MIPIKLYFLIISILAVLIIYTGSLPLNADLEEDTITARIIGGKFANETEFLYQVSLQTFRGQHICGGSIINKNWVLTAAHCLRNMGQNLNIVTGTIDLSQPGATYRVSEFRKHPFYDKKYFNDLALLRVEKPIKFNNRTQPVILPKTNNLTYGEELVLSGWGSARNYDRSSQILKSLTVHYLDRKSCIPDLPNSSILGKGNFCFSSNSEEGACYGDSGGPLVDRKGVLYGVLNWGIPCAQGYPDVCADVAYYYNWIMYVINSD